MSKKEFKEISPKDLDSIIAKSKFDNWDYTRRGEKHRRSPRYIEIEDVVKAAGGKDKLKKMFKYSDECHSYLCDIERKLLNERHEKYGEVYPPPAEALWDFCESILPPNPEEEEEQEEKMERMLGLGAPFSKKSDKSSEVSSSLLEDELEDEFDDEEDPEWLEEQNSPEKAFEFNLAAALLEFDPDIDSVVPFDEAGIMTTNAGVVVNVRKLESESGKVLKGPFEFQVTIVRSK